MHLTFANKEILAVCMEGGSSKLADHQLEQLQRLLADLQAASTPRDLPIGLRFSESTAANVVLDISEECTLIARMDHVAWAVNDQEDWLDRDRIKIVGINCP